MKAVFYVSLYVGVPDASFAFPFAQLNGVRLAVPVVDPALVQSTTDHFRDVLAETFEVDDEVSPRERKKAVRGFSVYRRASDSNEVRRVSSLEALEAKQKPVTIEGASPQTPSSAVLRRVGFQVEEEGVELMRSAEEIPEEEAEGVEI